MNANKQEVRWAKGLSRKEKEKMTHFTGGTMDSIYLSGVSVSLMDYSHLQPQDRADFVGNGDLLIGLINCHGEDYKRYFTIPVDRVDEICDTLQDMKKKHSLNPWNPAP